MLYNLRGLLRLFTGLFLLLGAISLRSYSRHTFMRVLLPQLSKIRAQHRYKTILLKMYFTIGSSRVTFSPNRFSSPLGTQNHAAGTDSEKAIVNGVDYFSHPIRVANEDTKAWTVREVNDEENSDVMLLSSWRKALIPLLGLTTPIPMILALWYTFVQGRIFWRHSDYLWSKDRTVYIGLPFVVLDLLLVRKPILINGP